MYFNTFEYFLFFAIVWCLLRLLPRPGWVLLGTSTAFYLVAGWFDSVLIFSLILANWIVLANVAHPKVRIVLAVILNIGLLANWIVLAYVAHPKVRIVLAVILNIGLLAIIKYQAFLLGQDGGDSVAYFETVLPLGISFYTFQLLAFQIDSARGAVDNDPRTISFPLFIVFFPQLIAGPIVRAHQMMPQIRRLETGQRRRVVW